MASTNVSPAARRASHRVFNTPKLPENILLKTMELPIMGRLSLKLAHLDENLKVPSWNRKAVCAQMKTLLLRQRVNMAFHRTISQSVHIQRDLWFLPPVSTLSNIRLNPLFSADKYAYASHKQIPFTKISVCSTPQSKTSMHLNYHMSEERSGSWQEMRVTWHEEWESCINYSKRGSSKHDMQFTMQFPRCLRAGEVMEMIKLRMKERCPEKDHVDMFG